jgi:two-component sensor histidine kinase
MVASWKNRIGTKLFGMLSVVIALAMLPIAFVVMVSVSTFGTYSATINEDQIKQQAIEYLSRLTTEQGKKYEEYFNRAASAVSLMSTVASEVYNNLEGYAGTQTAADRLLWQPKNEMFISPRQSPVITVYWGGDTLTPEILQETRALQPLDALLEKTKRLMPDSLATHMITTSGIGRYHTWSERGKEVVRNLPKRSVFDLRDGAPMTIFTRGNYPTDRVGWTGIYKDDVLEGLMVTACGPIVDRAGKFRGITGIDLPLQTIVDDFMMEEEMEPYENRQVLFSFLVDQKGRIIAFPADYMAYFGIDVDFSSFKDSSDLLDYSLHDSREEGVKGLISDLLTAENSVHQIMVQGEPHIIAGQALPTLGWFFVLVTREGDLISSVERTQNALRGTLQDLKHDFFVNSLLTACIALLLVYMAVRYFVSPLQKITATAEQVGEGDLGARCDLRRQDELGSLGDAMNNMICKLAEANEMKLSYSRTLENDIRDRTRDLELKNQQLENLIADLHAESRERKKVTRALLGSEKQLQALLEEKDILLREVYHRTKNNMLVIISMLELQLDGIEDHRARRVFLETENRIRAMAMVHENLYMSRSLAEINLGQYLENMAGTLVDSMTIGNRISLEVICQPVKISFEQAIPLGLVVNELVTNSVKYAFPDEKKGKVRIELERQGTKTRLVVADNGIGLPPGLDIHATSSFGLQITANMVKKQLRGEITVNCLSGTEYIIVLPNFS